MKRLFILAALIALAPAVLHAAGYTVGGTFRHTFNQNPSCGSPTGPVIWSGDHAQQAYQHCTLKAHVWRVVSPTPTQPAVPTATARPTSPPVPTATPIPWPTVAPSPTAPSCQADYDSCLVLSEINGARAQVGVAPLALNLTQSACSMGHSQAMAASGQIWHVNASYPSVSFPNDLCVSYRSAGENVGEAGGYSDAGGLAAIFDQMMAEPHDPASCAVEVNHACNILNTSFRSVGIAVYSSAGAVWLTTDFTG
jgi:uncharacterized protein YkwD